MSSPFVEVCSRALFDAKMVHVTDPITALGLEIIDMWRSGRADMRTQAREIHPGLDPAGYLLFSALGRNDDPVTITRLRNDLGEEKSTLSRQIDALVKLGLAERHIDTSDSRARLVSLTPDGKRRFVALRKRNTERWHHTFSGWDSREVQELTRLLNKLRLSRPFTDA